MVGESCTAVVVYTGDLVSCKPKHVA